MKKFTRALIAALAVIVLAIIALNLIERLGIGAEPSSSLPGAGAGPAKPIAPKREWVSVGGAPIPSAEVVPAKESSERCVEGRVVDLVTQKGIADARLRFWPSLEVNTDAEGRFGARALWDRMTLLEVEAEGYFPFGSPGEGVSMVLSKGTCAAGLVIPLVPRVSRRGLVLDSDEKPIAGARITISSDDDAAAVRLVTDAEGRFTFSARDGALIEARADGFVPKVTRMDFAIEVTGELTIVLERPDAGESLQSVTLEVNVEVESTRGELYGATVIAWRDTRWGPLEVARVESAPASLDLEVEGPGPWLVQARNYTRSSNLAETRGEPVTLRVGESGKLRGRVQDEKGQPVTGFTVTFREKRGPIAEGEGESRHVLDARGEYALENLQSGVFNVSVTALGFAPSDSQEVRVGEGLDARADFILRPGGAFTGKVLDRKSRSPLARAAVSLESSNESLFAAAGTRTADDGSFTLGGLKPGRRSLFFAAEGHHARLVSVEVEAGKSGGPIEVLLTPLAQGEQPRLELVGIGAVLQAREDVLVITQVIAGGGASEVGLVAGDAVVSIEGQLTSNLGFLGGVELIRGQEGTWVLMSVRRADGSLTDLRVPRRVISPP
ncbi:MAG: carboxypeptidase regulatory-like domain-containing protein [Archangium sp.]|nr:carboxypeptidase regulatory-like domain-containing protein [Archangium sp.]